jgi:hypothetical protein
MTLPPDKRGKSEFNLDLRQFQLQLGYISLIRLCDGARCCLYETGVLREGKTAASARQGPVGEAASACLRYNFNFPRVPFGTFSK